MRFWYHIHHCAEENIPGYHKKNLRTKLFWPVYHIQNKQVLVHHIQYKEVQMAENCLTVKVLCCCWKMMHYKAVGEEEPYLEHSYHAAGFI